MQTMIAPALVESARAGSRAALEVLAAEVAPLLVGLARRAGARVSDVDDVAQDAAVAMLRGLGSLRDPVAFPCWIARVVEHATVAHYRRRKGAPALLGDAVDALAVDDDCADEDAAPVERPALPLGALTAAQGRAVRLHYFEGMPAAAVARRMRTTPGAVRVLLSKGRARLRAAVTA